MSDYLPLYNEARFLSNLPIRVSVNTIRDADFSHFHRHIQLCCVLSGELRHKINGTDYIQHSGSCAFLLPYMSHTLNSKDSEDTPVIAYVWFDESFLTERGYSIFTYGRDTAHFDGFKIPAVCEFPDCKEDAIRIIRDIINEFNMQKNMSCDKIAAHIAELMRIACTEPVKKKVSAPFLRRLDGINRAATYVIKNYADKLDIDALSEIADMSRRRFTDNFKAITGFTVAEYILSVRLFYAQQQILYDDLLYDDVAAQCGLCNHSNLARVFMKYLGFTPTQYKTRHMIATSIAHEIPLRHRYKWLFEE